MKKYNVTYGAFVRGYAQAEFEAENDAAAKTKAIEVFKTDNGDDGLDWTDFDYENLAQPSIVSLQSEEKDVLEGHDFATNKDDARDYASREMLEMLKRIASFIEVMKRSGDLAHPNDQRLLAEIKTLILKAELHQ